MDEVSTAWGFERPFGPSKVTILPYSPLYQVFAGSRPAQGTWLLLNLLAPVLAHVMNHLYPHAFARNKLHTWQPGLFTSPAVC